ncbi:MAG: type III-B CRISPR module RAMP protein Cmr6 [Methanothrix sp.]
MITPRPLYRTTSEPKLGKGNAGLWYDKFCDVWNNDFSSLGDRGKQEWIKTVLNEDVGDTDLLKEMQERVKSLISNSGGKFMLFRTSAPFVTGLGRSHPVENGFAWHHTLGVPYLPGSSVKGLVRSWASIWKKVNNEEIKRIFGDEPESSGGVGSVVFLDALPRQPVKLKAEIMTPHYAPYYQGREPPADWHSPVPIPFLAVAEGQEFLFGVIPRKNGSEECEKVMVWLKEALEFAGAGAKTAVGYGRFLSQDTETPEPKPPETRTPGRKWLERLAEEKEKKKSVEEFVIGQPHVLVNNWEKIEDQELKLSALQEIKRIYQAKGQWDKPPSKGLEKVINHYKSWENKG